MSNQLAQELLRSLSHLEQAITETKESLAREISPKPSVLQRLECYEEVLRKQKVLAEAMQQHLKDQNWEQVRRHVELIRGSSLLIQLDSESIITEMTSGPRSSAQSKFHD